MSTIPEQKPTGFWNQTAAGIHVYTCGVARCGFSAENPVKAGVEEAARWHRADHKASYARLAVCPECRNGKHPNCDELAIDENDELTKCQCPDPIHPTRRNA